MFKRNISYNSIDGLQLKGDLWSPAKYSHAVLMVHGITSERTEEGLYTSIAQRLYEIGIGAMAFDFRGHGESGGTQEQLTIQGILNDILASIDYCFKVMSIKSLSLIASSFGGGIAIRGTFLRSSKVSNLVLLNPRLEYKSWITGESCWLGDRIVGVAAESLRTNGYLLRGTFCMGVPLINEILHVDPTDVLGKLLCDVLFIHGTEDSIIPIKSTIARYKENERSYLIEIVGADHGFVHPESDNPYDPISQEFRKKVVDNIIDWLKVRLNGE